ncbi:helix-turn-helix domain-containing protein [Candidatus Woesearchaeota archaeon]|nr:helix-turn-helix domain-containing protein [Candidatus Woesearchaeota archaeon]
MTQEDFAKLLQEKESMLAKWELNETQPNISTAEKIGRILGLNVILKEESFVEKLEQRKNKEEFTLGDFIKVRKRGGK